MKKCALIILDGYGEGKSYKYNAIKNANTPYIDSLKKENPFTFLKADSEAVGLPAKTMGGSEVGHFTMGAGKVVFQSLMQINNSIKDKSFFKNEHLINAEKHKNLHIIGMISDAGVHSHIKHLYALLKLYKNKNFENIYIHCISDGRDVKEKSVKKYLKKIEKHIKKIKNAKIASIIGRYYAMDRDNNQDRTKIATELYTKAKGMSFDSYATAIKHFYKENIESDYYLPAISLEKSAKITKDDAVIFFNYRTDRAAQIYKELKKTKCYITIFGDYGEKGDFAFKSENKTENLGSIFEKLKIPELRIAETEKFAHMTFFFNSQRKKAYKYEDRIMLKSKKVKSFAEKPEMSANEISNALIKTLKENPKKYKFIGLNYANCDLVGHSGDYEASIKAVETIDKNLKKIVPALKKANYHIIITADHGNAEFMKYKNGDPCPSHTLNPVICMIISDNVKKLKKIRKRGLKNIAATILKLMEIDEKKYFKEKALF